MSRLFCYCFSDILAIILYNKNRKKKPNYIYAKYFFLKVPVF